MIQIFRNGPGPWAEVDALGTTVILASGDAVLSLDCAYHQSSARKTIDVVRGEGGTLKIGTANGTAYVATLEIPPARYETRQIPRPAPPPETEEGTEEGEDVDDGGGFEESVEIVTLPLTASDMATVILRLFTVTQTTEVYPGQQ